MGSKWGEGGNAFPVCGSYCTVASERNSFRESGAGIFNLDVPSNNLKPARVRARASLVIGPDRRGGCYVAPGGRYRLCAHDGRSAPQDKCSPPPTPGQRQDCRNRSRYAARQQPVEPDRRRRCKGIGFSSGMMVLSSKRAISHSVSAGLNFSFWIGPAPIDRRTCGDCARAARR